VKGAVFFRGAILCAREKDRSNQAGNILIEAEIKPEIQKPKFKIRNSRAAQCRTAYFASRL
jgi:hypothetical protein